MMYDIVIHRISKCVIDTFDYQHFFVLLLVTRGSWLVARGSRRAMYIGLREIKVRINQ